MRPYIAHAHVRKLLRQALDDDGGGEAALRLLLHLSVAVGLYGRGEVDERRALGEGEAHVQVGLVAAEVVGTRAEHAKLRAYTTQEPMEEK